MDQVTLPARRVALPLPLHQKRILWLVAIALVLAVIGALVGTRLLSRPRQVRSSVSADLRVLDARISDVVECLGGPGSRADGSELPQRLTERSLTEEDWPAVVMRCRRSATLLLAAASAITASAQAAPGRVPQPIRKHYHQALDGAGRLLTAVNRLVDDVHEGRRVPAWAHVTQVAKAVGEVHLSLGLVERLAGFDTARPAPADPPPTRPAWPLPARLSEGVAPSRLATLEPFAGEAGRDALRLVDPDAAVTDRLLTDPLGEAQWQRLPVRVERRTGTDGAASAGRDRPGAAALALHEQPPRWLALVSPRTDPLRPSLFFAQAMWDPRTGRAWLRLGHHPPGAFEAQVAWPPLHGVVARPWVGLANQQERAVVAGAARGPAHALVLLRSRDGGATFERPLPLADDAEPAVRPRLLRSETEAPLLVYAVRSGGTALQVLPRIGVVAPPTPGKPGGATGGAATGPAGGKASGSQGGAKTHGPPTSAAHGATPQAKPSGASDPGIAPRVRLDTGAPRPLRALCRAAGSRLYLVDGHGHLWAGTLPAGPFRRLALPGAPASTAPATEGSPTRLACFGERAAVAWPDARGRFRYTTCDLQGCRPPTAISWSRLDDVLLVPTKRSVLVLARDPWVVFQRRDPKAAGKLHTARPVMRLLKPVRLWHVVAGRDPQRLALLLWDTGLGRLRSTDGGRRWVGE